MNIPPFESYLIDEGKLKNMFEYGIAEQCQEHYLKAIKVTYKKFKV